MGEIETRVDLEYRLHFVPIEFKFRTLEDNPGHLQPTAPDFDVPRT